MAKSLIGIVSSDKRDKTITVSIVSRETHPLYRKQYTKTRKYTAHDEKNEAHVGDKVEIVACRPFSKTVNYNLVKVLEKSHDTITLKEDVNAVEIPEKVGADAAAKAAKAEAEAKEADASEEEKA